MREQERAARGLERLEARVSSYKLPKVEVSGKALGVETDKKGLMDVFN